MVRDATLGIARVARVKGMRRMATYDYTNTTAKSFDAPAEGTYTLTFSEQGQQIVLMALGGLLGSVKREEHLTPAIEEMIAQMQSAQAISNYALDASRPDPANRTTDED